jgi:uracil-DNA glycosylase
MKPERVKIEDTWKRALWSEFEQPYFDKIKQRSFIAKNSGMTVYPPGSLIFNAFDLTPLNKVKVVIIGQDPYHGPGEAMGLSFSVPRGVRIPPSLRNIFKELHADTGTAIPDHGDLTSWAEQGVLLLNAMLTVEHKNPGSHKSIGWQQFTKFN